MQIRTCLTNNRICVSIIHCDFDGYFYRKKCVLYTGKYGTVEPCYLELKPISLGFALLFSVIYYRLSRTQLSKTPYLKQRAADSTFFEVNCDMRDFFPWLQREEILK